MNWKTMAAAEEISLDAAIAAVLSDLDGIFTFDNIDVKTLQTAFLCGQLCFTLDCL